jgi:hypothetical protein
MTKIGISPATLTALLSGNVENAFVAMTPGGIEAQEAQGQRDFVANETLPIDCGWDCKPAQVEAMGVVYGDAVDDMFIRVQLPEGWSKVATDHSMWSKLLDEKGRERASIFYKAAFYDRSAHINLARRFHCDVQPVCGLEQYYERGREAALTTELWRGIVWDYDGIVWEHPQRLPARPSPTQGQEYSAWYRQERALQEEVKAWLFEHYPDYEDPLAYWDVEVVHMDSAQP